MEASGLNLVQGKTERFMTPSGDWITIREQNGNDDDIISNSGKAKDGTSFNEFIMAIVVKSERYGGKLTLDNILDMPLRDKYFILIKSRIHSLGNIISFKYNWGDEVLKNIKNYEDDLNDYIWDYSKPFPEEGSEDYNENRIPPYPGDETYFELELSSGKVVRMDFLNGRSEKYLLTIGENDQSANVVLKARNIQLKNPEGLVKVHNFGMFSARDMSEIRTGVLEFDKEVQLLSKVENPDNGFVEYINLIQIPDFFFPVLS